MEFSGSVDNLTIHKKGLFQKINSNFMFQKPDTCPDTLGSVKVEDELTSFLWTFDYHSCSKVRNGKHVSSPLFHTPRQPNRTLHTNWRLQLYPNGKDRKSRRSMSLYLVDTEDKTNFFIDSAVYFALVDANSLEVNRTSSIEIFSMGTNGTWGVDDFVDVKVIAENSELLQQGNLTIKCCIARLKTLAKLGESSIPRPTPMPRSRSLSTLLQYKSGESEPEEEVAPEDDEKIQETRSKDSFVELLESGQSDVMLTAGGKVFYAHKVILANRSEIFGDIFREDTRSMSVIDMEDVDSDTLTEVMRYVYLGKTTDKLETLATKILAPANKFGLTELKDMCEDVMIRDLSVDNASEFLVLSFQHQASRVQERAMEFMVGHSTVDIMNTPGFRTMAGPHADVIASVFRALKKSPRSRRPTGIVEELEMKMKPQD